MRVLGVIRLSRETDETTSPERQRAGLEAWATALGHQIVGWAEDLDVSGKLSPWKRDDLGQWLSDKPPTEFDIVAATKIDRLSRDLGDFVDLIDWTSVRGKYVVAYMDSVDTSTPTGELVAKVLAIFAEFERKTIAKRSADSQQYAREQGRWHGGLPPYGYKAEKQPIGEGWKLVPDPEGSEIVGQVIKRVLEGESLNSICRDFNESGILSPRDHYRKAMGKPTKNNRWNTPVISGILRSRALLGIAIKDGRVVRGEDGLPILRSDPIVDRPTWDLVQAKLDENAVKKPRTRQTSPLLGITYCIACGNALYRFGSARDKGEYYRCRGKVWKLGCEVKSVRADALTGIIENRLLEHVGNVEILEEVRIPGESHRTELAEALEAHQDLLKMSAGKSEAVKKSYSQQITAVEALIERLSALPETADRVEHRPTGSTYGQVWKASDPQERRALLLKAGVRIEAAPAVDGWVSVGRFERPERYDQAVSLGVTEGMQYAFFLPRDLVDRATRIS